MPGLGAAQTHTPGTCPRPSSAPLFPLTKTPTCIHLPPLCPSSPAQDSWVFPSFAHNSRDPHTYEQRTLPANMFCCHNPDTACLPDGIPSKSRWMQLGTAGLIRDISLNEAQTPGEAEVPPSVQTRLLDPQPECLYREGQTRMGDSIAMRILTAALGGLWAASL